MKLIFPKLPMWATVKETYWLVWNNRTAYWLISRYWLLSIISVIYLYDWIVWRLTDYSNCMGFGAPKTHILNGAQELIVQAPFEIFMLLVAASIAVTWHRLILRNEHIASNRLRFDSLVLHYFIFALLLWLPSEALGFLNFIKNNFELMLNFIGFIASIIILVVATRLSLMLPVKALAISGITIKDIWRATDSNFWRLFTGALLCAFPLILAGISIWLIKPSCGNFFIDEIFRILSQLCYIAVGMPLYLTFLSLSYRHFFEKPTTTHSDIYKG